MAYPAARRNGGFTLIELMIVIVIIAILSTLGAPAFMEMIVTVRLRSAASELYEAATLARSEAIKRSDSVDVIPSASGWVDGWTVQHTDSTTAVVTVVQSHEALSGITVAANATGNLTYRPDGRVASNLRQLTLTATNSTNVAARCVNVDASGRPTIRTDTDQDATNGCN